LLVIFDLDDTLIDTSGCITPHKLEDALRAMIGSGLEVVHFQDSLDLLKRLNASAESSPAALAEFLEILDAKAPLLEVGKQELATALPADLPIFSLDGAVEVLTELAEDHKLALVTVGVHSLQMEKLKKAGIDSGFFSKIAVSESRDKKTHYQLIMEELEYSPSEVVVCGDRVAIDLLPAKELGFKTVHVRWGRGLNSHGKEREVDYSISDLRQLKEIVTNLMSFSSF